MTSYLDSAAQVAARPVSADAAFDDDFHTLHPALHTYLTATVDGNDKPRRVSTLVLFSEAGEFKGTLIERNHEVQLWATASSVLGVLEALEEDLAGGSPSWRKPTQGLSRRRS